MKRRVPVLITALLLSAVLLSCLVACMPSDPDEAAANLENAGYIVVSVKADGGSGVTDYLLPDGCTAYVSAYKKHNLIGEGESIEMYYFKDSDSAAAYMEKNEGWANEINDLIVEKENLYREGYITEEEFTTLKEILESTVMKKEGNLVYKGTAEAVKAAK